MGYLTQKRLSAPRTSIPEVFKPAIQEAFDHQLALMANAVICGCNSHQREAQEIAIFCDTIVPPDKYEARNLLGMLNTV